MTSCHCLPEPGRCFPVTLERAGLEGVAMHDVDSQRIKAEGPPGIYSSRDFCNAMHREKTYSDAYTGDLFIRHETIQTLCNREELVS